MSQEIQGHGGRGGLCPGCAHVQRVESAKGSVFWLCAWARNDPRYTKYPPQPVLRCLAFERAPGEDPGKDRGSNGPG